MHGVTVMVYSYDYAFHWTPLVSGSCEIAWLSTITKGSSNAGHLGWQGYYHNSVGAGIITACGPSNVIQQRPALYY